MLKKLFGKTPTEDKVVAPVSGELVSITDVPDPTFSQKMMGDGIAIKPSSGKVVAPVNGKVVNLFPTKHAVGIESEAGVEYLIHIGLETVSLNGEGFEAHVKQGDKVSAGDLLITVDLDVVSAKAESTITPLVITNDVSEMEIIAPQQVTHGETQIMTVKK
ncbi:PTS sugar transporter subunit IIA [Aquibacillus salsiterrae]|uniref:PTS glucose transporter subunit IIA n=1 Tax=Aquibacillus salsiterrae TaxID=2950439 RepID=A0A9X3WJL3_9BACI|nr:PTS glucose transporter subunit IIA [Aquibacillus salsiterrae]MDC3418534.1 PTS glucose transporter subunit IIA [Aquibacillus salsiterrae]